MSTYSPDRTPEENKRLAHIEESKHAGMTPEELHRVKRELRIKWQDAGGNAGGLARLKWIDAYLARNAGGAA